MAGSVNPAVEGLLLARPAMSNVCMTLFVLTVKRWGCSQKRYPQTVMHRAMGGGLPFIKRQLFHSKTMQDKALRNVILYASGPCKVVEYLSQRQHQYVQDSKYGAALTSVASDKPG